MLQCYRNPLSNLIKVVLGDPVNLVENWPLGSAETSHRKVNWYIYKLGTSHKVIKAY